MRSAIRYAVFVCVCLTVCPGPAGAQTTRPTSGEEIARLVAGLANRSYQKREQITRRIAEVGPAAIPYLRRELHNPKQEIALAARELMQELDEVLFAGASVRLEVDPPRVRWDQPVRLRIVVENGPAFPTKVPWKIPLIATTQPASLASRVGVMMDVGDFLDVTSPGDEPVDMRVEPIGDDRDVEAAVNERVTGGPASVLAPGKQCVLDIPEFNRGWARYPLLTKGRYRVQFTYQPDWSRAEWSEAGLGRIVSNTVEIEVTAPAPPAIRSATRPVRVLIAREAGQFVARLGNTWDRPLCVNLNFGADPEHAAQVCWLVLPKKGEPSMVTFPPADAAARAPLDAGRFRELRPAEEIELTRIETAALLTAAQKQSPGLLPEGAHVAVRYVNHATREDIRRAGEKSGKPAGDGLLQWVLKTPYPLFTGEPETRPTPLTPPEPTTRPAKEKP